jgi:putative SOS response-associated peptidase YedK
LPWMARTKRGDGLINIRAETLRDKTTFRDGLIHRRCLVIADGFYEWKKAPSEKIPYRIRLINGSPLGCFRYLLW